jgi:hypothetical protein
MLIADATYAVVLIGNPLAVWKTSRRLRVAEVASPSRSGSTL